VPFALRTRAQHRVVSDVWECLAGQLAVAADLASQGAAAARRQDASALDAFVDRLRVAILDAIRLHNTSDCFEDEVQS
jgi:hypothetical protein